MPVERDMIASILRHSGSVRFQHRLLTGIAEVKNAVAIGVSLVAGCSC
jgi:hypothetical protein